MVEGPSSVAVAAEAVINVEDVARFKEWDKVVVVSRVDTTIIAVGEVGVVVGSVGRTMINHKGIGTLPLTSNPTGKCSKKSISTA